MKKNLERLKRIERPAISEAIESAREHGDLKENAEYHAAKEKQGLIEGRIREFETKLAMAEVVDPLRLVGNTRVSFGASVRILDIDTDEEFAYAIVGIDEADFKFGLLSYKSPIARGILGKEEGDDCEVDIGDNSRTFEILSVEFKEIKLPDTEFFV